MTTLNYVILTLILYFLLALLVSVCYRFLTASLSQYHTIVTGTMIGATIGLCSALIVQPLSQFFTTEFNEVVAISLMLSLYVTTLAGFLPIIFSKLYRFKKPVVVQPETAPVVVDPSKHGAVGWRFSFAGDIYGIVVRDGFSMMWLRGDDDFASPIITHGVMPATAVSLNASIVPRHILQAMDAMELYLRSQ